MAHKRAPSSLRRWIFHKPPPRAAERSDLEIITPLRPLKLGKNSCFAKFEKG
jgi:hypothetical protein